jgi:hypothetical protein
MKAFSFVGPCIALCVFTASPITLTVGKAGADFTTINGALREAMPGDVIKIIDTAVYEEQVTIDSNHCPLTLTSANPRSLAKPTIKFQDLINVHPSTAAEARVDTLVNYNKNGALRIIKAHNVIIDGIAVDGAGVHPFGYPAIWEGRYSLQAGTVAITLFSSSDIVIRNCDISNAYFGVYTIDVNRGGIFAMAVPSDLDTNPIVPLSAFGQGGNHLFEYNRIHNNSWGMFFESLWDQGSTIRYNLIYENHHPTGEIAATAKGLTSDEGSNQPGGAFFFKDIPLCPLAIYNNTLYRNFTVFAGHWQAGYQHLIFNNIIGPPYEYWNSTTLPQFNTNPMELMGAFTNRMNSCVIAAQVQKPQETYVRVTDGLPQIQGTDSTGPKPGNLITGTGMQAGYPADADVRWLEWTSDMFLSMDAKSTNFLEPNWDNDLVKQFIAQKGWEASGVKNTDGTRADLGAISHVHGTPSFVGTIRATMPILISGGNGSIKFSLDERDGTTMTDPAIKLFRLVKIPYRKDSFGNGEKTIVVGAGQMTALNPPTTPPVKIGPNTYSVPIAIGTAEYAFIEMIVEATGADGKRFASAVGFIPYRNLDYTISVEVWDTTMTRKLTEVNVGAPVILRLTPMTTAGEVFTKPLSPLGVTLQSGFELMTPTAPNDLIPLTYPTGIPGGVDNKKVIFTRIPQGRIENIAAAGIWKNASTSGGSLAFLGVSSVKVCAGQAERPVFTNPPSITHGLVPPMLPLGSSYICTLAVFDRYGNLSEAKSTVKVKALTGSLVTIKPDSILTSNDAGVISFTLQTSDCARENDVILLNVELAGNGRGDTARMIVGKKVGVIGTPGFTTALSQKAFSHEAAVSVFDLQGRRIFRGTFLCNNGFIRSADFVRLVRPVLSAKTYVMETVLKDRKTMKVTKNAQKLFLK